jgi:hypothetical protein
MSTTDNQSYDCRVGEQIGETDDGQPVVAQGGDGSLTSGEALKDTNRPENRHAAHGRQRTTFHAREAEDSEKFRRLWKHQHGFHSDDTGQRAAKDKENVAEALADTLRLSDALKADVKRLVRQCDGRAFNRLGGLEAVALGAIAVAQNNTIERPEDYEDRIQVREYDHHDGDAPLFKALAEKHGVEWQKAIRKVKEEQQSGGQ